MLSVPLYYFFIVYAILVLILLGYFLLNISHLFQTRALTYVSFGFTLFVMLLVALNFSGTWNYLKGTNWTQVVELGGNGQIFDQLNTPQY